MSKTSSSPDKFARTLGVIAIGLTIISLYFTNRTYSWQKTVYEESLDEKILVRFGFKNVDNKGDIGLEVVNIGMHPIYIKSVEIQIPNGCEVVGVHHAFGDECWITIYDHKNESLKPLEPGDAANYTKNWNYANSSIQNWIQYENARERLWVSVRTTKKNFRQHPVFSWATIGNTIEFMHNEVSTPPKTN